MDRRIGPKTLPRLLTREVITIFKRAKRPGCPHFNLMLPFFIMNNLQHFPLYNPSLEIKTSSLADHKNTFSCLSVSRHYSTACVYIVIIHLVVSICLSICVDKRLSANLTLLTYSQKVTKNMDLSV